MVCNSPCSAVTERNVYMLDFFVVAGIHDKIIKEIEDIIRQLDALDPEGIIRNFLEGVLGELNNSESHESQTM